MMNLNTIASPGIKRMGLWCKGTRRRRLEIEVRILSAPTITEFRNGDTLGINAGFLIREKGSTLKKNERRK